MTTSNVYKLTFNDECIYADITYNTLDEELSKHRRLAHEGNHEDLLELIRDIGIKNIEIDLIGEEELREELFLNNVNINKVRTAERNFRFTVGSNCYDFKLENNYYSARSLIKAIRGYLDTTRFLVIEIDPDNRCVIVVPKDCTVDFTIDNSLAEILCFDKVVLTEGVHFGSRPISL